MLSVKYNHQVNLSRMARALGSRGGRERARRLPAAERTRIAALGGTARAQSLQAARRVADNFRYAAAVDALRARPASVKRLRVFDGRLPGIYPASG